MYGTELTGQYTDLPWIKQIFPRNIQDDCKVI